MQMRNILNMERKTLSVFMVWCMVFTGLFGIVISSGIGGSSSPPSTGSSDKDIKFGETWEINGYIHKQRGNVTVQNGGTIKIINGGLMFLQDIDHIYYMMVENGGKLVMNNSILTVALDLIHDYPRFNLTVNGNMSMWNNSTLKFPGNFVTNGGNITIDHSIITGFNTAEIYTFTTLSPDDNDDAPALLFNSSYVKIFDSKIEKIYESTLLTYPDARDLTLVGNTNLIVINSYISLDYSGDSRIHNLLRAGNYSRAYLYNMTIDESQDPIPPANREPAIIPTGQTLTYVPKDQGVLDTTGEPNVYDLVSEEGTYYLVDGLNTTQNTLYIDNFTTPLTPPLNYSILSVVLRVAYNTMGTPAGSYVGNNHIQWALEGDSLSDTTIRPVHTDYQNNIVNVYDSYNLYPHGVDTFEEISTLNVSYINDNDWIGVRFDRMWIVVTLEAESEAYIYRWLDLDVNDAAGIPVGGAEVSAYHTPSGDPAEYYVPSGIIQYVPPNEVLNYLGKSAGDYDLTDSSGKAFYPLLTEWINASTYPNSYFVGNYELTTTYLTLSDTSYISFEQYPAIKKEDNTYYGEVEFTDVAEPSSIYSGDTWYIIGDEIINGITYTWNGNVQINSTGNLTIRDGALYIAQGGTKHFINVLGSLILESGSIESDSPLNIYFADSGALTSTLDSTVLLNEGGIGNLIASDSSIITMTDSTLDANLYSDCSKVSLYYSTLSGSKVYIKSASESEIYNCDLSAVDELNLESDFDIRNIDFSLPLEFDGDQQIQLTNVTYPSLKVSDNAKVFEYWWLTVKTIDGAGSLLGSSRGANVTVVIERNGLPEYTAISTNDTDGVIINRVLSREITATEIFVRNSYSVTGNCTYPYPGGLTYYPDSNVSVVVSQNVEVQLIFSELTPDFSVLLIAFFGENILEHESNQQPADKELEIRATVHNAGNIDIDDVDVWIYNVEVNPAYPLSIYEQYKIGSESISMPRLGNGMVTVQWTPPYGITTISVVIDPLNHIQESNEENNIDYSTIVAFSWPDLSVSDEITFSPEPITDGISTLVSAKVHNNGAVAASALTVSFYDEIEGDSNLIGTGVMDISGGGEETASILWTPSQAGEHTIIVVARSANDSYYNCDYDYADNRGYVTTRVLTKPDLAVLSQDYSSFEVTEGETFTVDVIVYNFGETSAVVNLSLYDGSIETGSEIGSAIGLSIEAEGNIPISVDCKGVHGAHAHTLIIVVDPLNEIDEIDEENNVVSVAFNVRSITGIVYLDNPEDQDEFTVGALPIYASGIVRTDVGEGIAGAYVTVVLYEDVNSNGRYDDGVDSPVSSNVTASPTAAQGFFVLSLKVPSSAGEYRIVAYSTNMPTLNTTDIEIIVETPLSWWEQPFLGISLWTWIIIIILVLAAIIVVSIYLKFYGLGKMVECGACGAFIPEGTKKCPKCGVEFETETAKCSECSAWIPVDAKKCPSCGVAFVAGKKEVEDYAKKMKLQYEDIVDKFRQGARKELGSAFTEKEFQSWWKKQPTYVTFDKWLEEEEDKKKKGAVPCPVCRTLNSVRATICHKCGTLLVKEMKREEKSEEAKIPRLEEEQRFKRVVKKPTEVIVKKRVIKKPKEE